MNKLDLHGVRHIDVTNTLKRFIEDNWAAGEPIEVITGNSYVMQSLVTQVVKEYNLTIKQDTYEFNAWANIRPSLVIEF
jgi:hypothetical protein